MKTLGINQMELIQGGDEWHYSWTQHVGCAAVGNKQDDFLREICYE